MTTSFYKPLRIASLKVPGNLFLAPVAGYSDAAFRSVCINCGADLSCTELISSEAMIRGSKKTADLLYRAANEKVFVVQLFGAKADVMAAAAAALAPFQPSAIDINCGCPVPKVVKTGAGSALLRDPPRLGQIVSAVAKVCAQMLGGIPVSVKLRSGWDEASINYRETARIAVESGAALIAFHARTRAQQYNGQADWLAIADLVSRLDVPVIGSGDLFTAQDAEKLLRESGCAGVMFARGAIGNPFIFTETKTLLTTGTYTATPADRKIAIGLQQLELAASFFGEALACREIRKHFCSYTKGLPGGAALRTRLMQAETVAEYRAILEAYF